MNSKRQTQAVSLDAMLDKHIGKSGSAKREAFEQKLRMDLLGQAIRQARIYHELTQEELGKLVGVQKSQISKLENNFTDARFGTMLKVFEALNVKVNFSIDLPKKKLKAA